MSRAGGVGLLHAGRGWCQYSTAAASSCMCGARAPAPVGQGGGAHLQQPLVIGCAGRLAGQLSLSGLQQRRTHLVVLRGGSGRPATRCEVSNSGGRHAICDGSIERQPCAMHALYITSLLVAACPIPPRPCSCSSCACLHTAAAQGCPCRRLALGCERTLGIDGQLQCIGFAA